MDNSLGITVINMCSYVIVICPPVKIGHLVTLGVISTVKLSYMAHIFISAITAILTSI